MILFWNQLLNMGRIKEIADSTENEVTEYLDHLGWDENPFTNETTVDSYVLPNEGDMAEILLHIQEYSGPVVVHSELSGVGKTTLVKILLEELSDEYETIYIGEHNVTPYELVAIVADRIGVGKSSSTKLTEDKILEADTEKPYLIAIDEFGLNDPDTLHTIQFLNDELDARIVMTGMTNQWDSVSGLGSEGKAFKRRTSYELELSGFSFNQCEEYVKRKITTVTDTPYDEWESVDYTNFITEDALEFVKTESHGVAGVINGSLADAITLVSYTYANDQGSVVTTDMASRLRYTDPQAESE